MKGSVTRGDTLTLGAASGFWGDRNDALLRQVEGGHVDVVFLDYLAEVTLSVLRVQMGRDPDAGYATDFLDALEPALEKIAAGGVRVVTNAGGMNPRGLAAAVAAMAQARSVPLRIGVVTGDDVFEQLSSLTQSGVSLAHMDTGKPFDSIASRVLSANVYLGAAPIAEAIRAGADLVITGRCADSALALGPLMAHFDWTSADLLAAGTVVGHLLECGAQASGGNYCGGWEKVPDLDNIGFPIAHVERSGEFVVTKHPGTGGLITPAVLKEQLLYEIGDPADYLTPDVSVDFTTLGLTDLGANRVRVFGVTGREPPRTLKASICFEDGFKNVASLTFVWPRAIERAKATEAILLARFQTLGLSVDRVHFELLGVSGAAGPMAPPPADDPAEVVLRVAVKTKDRSAADQFGKEIAPLILSGMPGACRGLGDSGRPRAKQVVNHWPALLPRDAVYPEVTVQPSGGWIC